jgi:hypothetical protein
VKIKQKTNSEIHIAERAHFGSMRNSASNSVLGAVYTLGAGADAAAAPSALPLPLPLKLPLTASHASMNSRSAAASSAALSEAGQFGIGTAPKCAWVEEISRHEVDEKCRTREEVLRKNARKKKEEKISDVRVSENEQVCVFLCMSKYFK